MALYQTNAGDRILAADINQFYNILKGVAASGETVTLIYNNTGALLLQPSSDPSAGTQLLQIKNSAGTAQSALTSDGKILLLNQKFVENYTGGNTGTTPTADFNNADTQTWTLNGNATFTFSNPKTGRYYTLIITMDGSVRTITWPTIKWAGGAAPALSGINKTDVLTFYYDGTNYWGSAQFNFA